MAYADSHEAARALAFQRWGTRGLDRAVDTVLSRSAELSAEQMRELAEVLDHQEADDDGR